MASKTKKTIKRKEGWEQILEVSVNNARNRQFNLGSFDCCLFACNVIRDMTDVDLMREFRKTYSTAREAVKEIQRAGTLTVGISNQIGDPINKKLLGRGDLVLYKNKILGLCIGEYAAFVVSSGISFVPMAAVKYGWKI